MGKSSKRLKQMLFIGNSFTARNDLLGLISQLASAHGIEIKHRLLSIGGASLRTHWNKGEARSAIQSGMFDYIVLQEQSTLPIKNASRMRENVLLFAEEIRAARGQAVLYMTWARKPMPEKQKLISESYESVGREIGAIVVPAGNVWWRFIAKHKSPALHDKDQSHPTLAGSYLAACVFLKTMFDKSPVGIESKLSGLGAEEVHALQRAADVNL